MAVSTWSGAVEVSTVVRGYHVFQEIWTALLGFCQWKPDNHHDWFVVAIVKDGEVVGHVRREISLICFMFLSIYYVQSYWCRFACSDQELLKTTSKLLGLALKKIDTERPLKRIKLEPEETPVVLVPYTSQPKGVPSGASEVIIVSDEPDCSSNSKT